MASPEITLTHLDEPLFDGADATKRDLVDYLEAVGDRIVSVLSGRPLSVIRARAGQRPFMQKNVPDYAPPWIKTVSVWAESSPAAARLVPPDEASPRRRQRACDPVPRVSAGRCREVESSIWTQEEP